MQSPRWTWLTLIACAAAAADAVAQPADPAPAPRASTGELADLLPPYQWTGSVAYDVRSVQAQGEGRTTGQLFTGNLGLRSYIYQPWFARINGSLLLTRSWTETHPETRLDPGLQTDASLHERIRAREQFATGNARVDVFPLSRFPFEAHVDRSDSRIDSGLASTFSFRTQTLGFTQRYRPVNGAWDLTGGYERREQTSLASKATQDLFTGDFNTRWKYNQLNLNASDSRARATLPGDESRYGTLVARHNYAPSTALSIDTTANWSRTEDRALVSSSDLRVMQWSSVGLWRRENSPLSLTGTVRALQLREDRSGTSLDTWGATLGGNYDYDRNLRLTANTGFTFTNSGGNGGTGLAGTVGATWQADSIAIGAARYDWFASGSAGTTRSDGDRVGSERQTALNLQLGHSLQRAWNTGDLSSLTFSASQTLSRLQAHSTRPQLEAAPDVFSSLSNTVAGTWQSGGTDRSLYIRGTWSDTLSLQGPENRFRMFNFQFSGNLELDNRRSLTGDLTYQRTSQEQQTRLDGTLVPAARQGSSGASGELVYRHLRPFDVPRMRFESRLKLAQDVLKQPGTLQSIPDRETRLWENRLDWSIGRIDMQGILRLSLVDGRRREAFMFRIQRTFGD